MKSEAGAEIPPGQWMLTVGGAKRIKMGKAL